MLEAGIVAATVLVVWAVVSVADRWGSRETYAVETDFTVETKNAVKARHPAGTRRTIKETV